MYPNKGINYAKCIDLHYPKKSTSDTSSSDTDSDTDPEGENRPLSILNSLNDNVIHCYPENVQTDDKTTTTKKKRRNKKKVAKISTVTTVSNRFSCLETDNELYETDPLTSVTKSLDDSEDRCDFDERFSSVNHVEHNDLLHDQSEHYGDNLETVSSRKNKKKKSLQQSCNDYQMNQEQFNNYVENSAGCYFADNAARKWDNENKKKKSRKKSNKQIQNVAPVNEDGLNNKTGALKKRNTKVGRVSYGSVLANQTKGELFINEMNKQIVENNVNNGNVQEFIQNVIMEEARKHYEQLLELNNDSPWCAYSGYENTLPIFDINQDEFPPLPPSSWLEEDFPQLLTPVIDYNFTDFPPLDQPEKLQLNDDNFPHLQDVEFLSNNTLLDLIEQLDLCEINQKNILDKNDFEIFPNLNSTDIFNYNKIDFPSLRSLEDRNISPKGSKTSLEYLFERNSPITATNSDVCNNESLKTYASKVSTTGNKCFGEDLDLLLSENVDFIVKDSLGRESCCTQNVLSLIDKNYLQEMLVGDSEEDFKNNVNPWEMPVLLEVNVIRNPNASREETISIEADEYDTNYSGDMFIRNMYTWMNKGLITLCDKILSEDKPYFNNDTCVVTMRPPRSLD